MGFGKDGKGVIIRENLNQALGTLAGSTGLLVSATATMGEDFRILKSEIIASVEGLTALEGVLELHLVNGELSLVEVEENLELTGVSDRNDRVANERAMRFVHYIGSFIDYAGLGQARPIVGHEGQAGMAIIKPRWTFSDPEAWDYAVYNRSAGALTSGATLRLLAKHFGVWVT